MRLLDTGGVGGRLRLKSVAEPAIVHGYHTRSVDAPFTKGEEHVGTFNKTERSARKFCKICGGHVMSDHPGFGLVDIYATIVPELKHEPTLHVFYEYKTISMKDGLPKFKDLPGDFGGSGDTLPE